MVAIVVIPSSVVFSVVKLMNVDRVNTLLLAVLPISVTSVDCWFVGDSVVGMLVESAQ